jgi:ABC-type antimicrobial peptide transport system permease subunit
LHDIYADRRRQYATLIAIGFSPGLDILPAIGFGMVLAVVASFVGSALAFALAPDRFAMPSLMADLGTVVPSFDLTILGVVFMVTTIAIAMGLTPTAWRLYRSPIANTLASEAP